MSHSLTSSPQETRQPLSQSGHLAHRSFSLEVVRNPGAHTITGALYRDPALPSLRPRRRVRVSAGGTWGLREFKASPGDSQVEDHCPAGCASPTQSGWMAWNLLMRGRLGNALSGLHDGVPTRSWPGTWTYLGEKNERQEHC